jgi:ketosteroid isomerase-like protein
MSRENVDAWQRAREAFNARSVEGMMAELHPDAVFTPLVAGVAGQSYRGEQGIRDWVATIDEEFESFWAVWDEIEDHGDFVLSAGNLHGRGRTSGVEVSRPSVHIARFEGGKVVWWQTYDTREEALAAAGLGAQASPG